MKIARTSLTLGIVRSRPRSRREIFSPYTTIETVYITKYHNISPISQLRHMLVSMSVNNLFINIITLE